VPDAVELRVLHGDRVVVLAAAKRKARAKVRIDNPYWLVWRRA